MFVIRSGQDTFRYMWIVREGLRLTTTSANCIPVLHILRHETLLDKSEAVLTLEQDVFDPVSADSARLLTHARIWASSNSSVVEVGPER
jgi:hypothetical protein